MVIDCSQQTQIPPRSAVIKQVDDQLQQVQHNIEVEILIII